MYKEGLIDPEFITTDMTKIQQDISRGRFGMAYGPQWGTWSPWNYAYTAENNWAVTHAYPVPTKAGYTPMYGYSSNKAAGEIVVINSRVSNPEAVVKMVNHYIAFNNDWQNDADRIKYQDNEQYRFAPTWVAEPQEVRVQPLLFDALTRNDPSDLAPMIHDWYNKIRAFQANPKGHDADTYGRWGQYAEDMAMTIVMNYYPKSSMIESSLGAVQPESLLTGAASLEKIVDQTYTEIITGQRPVSYFDTFVQQFLTAGGQKILDDLEAAYGAK
jgi:putative aldouronate transport system substrate-binding protein